MNYASKQHNVLQYCCQYSPLLLSFLFFFIFSFPHPSHCTSLTCKDVVIQYWKLKFGDDKPPPPLFLAKLSTLSPLELATHFANITMVPKDDNHRSLEVVVDSQCENGSSGPIDDEGPPAPFLLHDSHRSLKVVVDSQCDNGSPGPIDDEGPPAPFLLQDGYGSSKVVVDPLDDDGPPGPPAPFLLYNGYRSSKEKSVAAVTGDTDSASENKIRVDEVKERTEASTSLSSMFFREKDLKKGATLLLPDFGSKYPPLTFLPRSIASNIPLSASAIREMFNIPKGTRWDKGIEKNIGLCAGAPNKGEIKRCVTSAEDMIDLVVQLLGTNATARTTESYSGAGGKILIGDVKAVNDGKLGTSLACHQTLLPYLVHLCHTLPNSRVYEFEILDVETKKKINSGAAVCHVHVSGSKADHRLGKDPVCHWIFKWDLIWATIIQH